MKCIVDNEVRSLIRELQQLREVVAFQSGKDQNGDEHPAKKAMDPQLLHELELTTSFVRMLSLQGSIVRHSRPSSTIQDVVESVKLRQAVEELQKLRATQRSRQAQRAAHENRSGAFQQIFQTAYRVCEGIKG